MAMKYKWFADEDWAGFKYLWIDHGEFTCEIWSDGSATIWIDDISVCLNLRYQDQATGIKDLEDFMNEWFS